jgi:hypothetical protein
MSQEHFAAEAREENTDGRATLEDFAFEELEDRLELVRCFICSDDGTLCVEVMCDK